MTEALALAKLFDPVAGRVARGNSYLSGMAELGELIDDGAVKVNDVTSLAATIDARREQWVANMPESAPDGVDSPQALIDSYHESLENWTQVLVTSGSS
ncbi:hypothetical protein [Microbacterium sp. A84]|uniref:hypothetical protein n=1 Tax=Microbacterium sp. A84 TaxID=3450715 RepID=UPI003F421F2E